MSFSQLDGDSAKKIVSQEPLFSIIDEILFYIDTNSKGQVTHRAVLPTHLCQSVMEENHRGPFAGHFSGDHMYRTLRQHWWWEGMYSSCIRYARNCPKCTVVTSGGRNTKPPLYPIPPVERPFQIIGVDIMELPCTRRGNRYVLVFQDFLYPIRNHLELLKY